MWIGLSVAIATAGGVESDQFIPSARLYRCSLPGNTPLTACLIKVCACARECVCVYVCHLKQVHCNTTNKLKNTVFLYWFCLISYIPWQCLLSWEAFLKKAFSWTEKGWLLYRKNQHKQSPSKPLFFYSWLNNKTMINWFQMRCCCCCVKSLKDIWTHSRCRAQQQENRCKFW